MHVWTRWLAQSDAALGHDAFVCAKTSRTQMENGAIMLRHSGKKVPSADRKISPDKKAKASDVDRIQVRVFMVRVLV
jgi:hypothetical protein